MSTETIEVLLVKPMEKPRIIRMEDSLEAMQEVVGGGLIEEYMPFIDPVAIVCNEEGKMRRLPLNRGIYDGNGSLMDIIAGDFFICYAPADSEKFLSLPEDLRKKYAKQFEHPERFVRTVDGLKAVKMVPYRGDLER